MTLHDVGGVTAGVGDGIMDPGCIDDMLPQKIRTDVHQLHGVERTAPQMGLDSTRGCRDGVKAVEHLAVGKRGQIAHAGRVGRVPAERLRPVRRTRHREPEMPWRSRFPPPGSRNRSPCQMHRSFPGYGLDGKRRSERTDAEQVMPTAVTTEAAGGIPDASRPPSGSDSSVRRIRPECRMDRPAAAETPGKGGRDMPKSGLELKPFCSQALPAASGTRQNNN